MNNKEPRDYKDTLNLPKTSFPMKANLPVKEPQQIDVWRKGQIYEKMAERNLEKTSFVMPDGPPYANGNIHVGHVLNKVLKDIVIKYKNMNGHHAALIPGWDCHGLPIELKVTKALGSKKKDMTHQEIRDCCRKEALKWVDIQREQFKRLGILADWDNPYLTLQPEYEAEEVRVLAKILRNGLLVRGEKPVYWCPALQTALAAAEVEYADHTSPSVYVKFFLEDQKSLEKIQAPNDKPTAVVIWTTTPWTLPANYGICFHADFNYGIYDSGDDYLVIAEELKEPVEEATGLSLKLVKSLKGKVFDRLLARHPFMERDSLVMLGEHVTLEAGTGCVHTAPAHGLDDYHIGLKYDLPVKTAVDAAGKFTEDVPQYEGMKIWDANKKISEDLKSSGHLIGYSEIKHSYPHNPRSKTPLIFRATPQWFIKMDNPEFPLREKALKAVENDIQFFPQWGKQRLKAMLTHGPDWCLSRQRIWGVPIPVFYCSHCQEPLVKPEIMEHIANIMESTGEGLEAYFSRPVSELLGDQPGAEKCKCCGKVDFTKGTDILDVWFDSGVCHSSVQKKRTGLGFPADIYLEGSDQHRGWFQTSLNSSLAAYDQPPFKALITHGFVNDSQGFKMSKSRGNVLNPADIIKQQGAEILRLWVAYEDYGQDVNVSQEMLARVTETYRRIRNTLRFLLGNIGDFDFKSQEVEFSQMPPLDQWALVRLNELVQRVTIAYDNYDFYKIYHNLNNFFTLDLSSIYLDVLKDRLYTGKKDGLERRASQTVLHHSLHTLVGLMAPILSFLAEEVYQHLPEGTSPKMPSVFLTDFPTVHPQWKDPQLMEDFEQLVELRSKCSKQLELLRQEKIIGSSLEAQLLIKTPSPLFEVLTKYKDSIKEFFIVSQVSVEKSDSEEIQAQKIEGEKCIRCWHYSKKTGTIPEWPEICPKCVEALS